MAFIKHIARLVQKREKVVDLITQKISFSLLLERKISDLYRR